MVKYICKVEREKQNHGEDMVVDKCKETRSLLSTFAKEPRKKITKCKNKNFKCDKKNF